MLGWYTLNEQEYVKTIFELDNWIKEFVNSSNNYFFDEHYNIRSKKTKKILATKSEWYELSEAWAKDVVNPETRSARGQELKELLFEALEEWLSEREK